MGFLQGIEPKKAFEVLPQGVYNGIINSVSEDISKGEMPKKFYSIEIDLLLDDGSHRKCWKRCFLQGSDEQKTKTLLGMFSGLLEDCGVTKEQRDVIDGLFHVKAYLEGLNVEVTLSVREYEGKLKNEVLSIKKKNPF